MKELTKFQSVLLYSGAVILLVSALGFMFSSLFAYSYLLGALLFGAMQVMMTYEGSSITIRRLRRQQIFGAFMLVLAGPLMICNHTPVLGYRLFNEWMVALLIGALLQLYTSFRIPSELKKKER